MSTFDEELKKQYPYTTKLENKFSALTADFRKFENKFNWAFLILESLVEVKDEEIPKIIQYLKTTLPTMKP